MNKFKQLSVCQSVGNLMKWFDEVNLSIVKIKKFRFLRMTK